MMYLTGIFIPPLYFAARKKWGAFILNGILYSLAWLGLMTILFSWIGITFWALAVGHLRREFAEQHADMVASKMAEKMKEKNNKGESD